MNVPHTPLDGPRRREAANSPEVHAAAIRAAAELYREALLKAAGEGFPDLSSPTVARTVALHAAVLLRTYLSLVGQDEADRIGARTPGD
jgi:hypothetical protein